MLTRFRIRSLLDYSSKLWVYFTYFLQAFADNRFEIALNLPCINNRPNKVKSLNSKSST